MKRDPIFHMENLIVYQTFVGFSSVSFTNKESSEAKESFSVSIRLQHSPQLLIGFECVNQVEVLKSQEKHITVSA